MAFGRFSWENENKKTAMKKIHGRKLVAGAGFEPAAFRL
jgi:hypothetical protein